MRPTPADRKVATHGAAKSALGFPVRSAPIQRVRAGIKQCLGGFARLHGMERLVPVCIIRIGIKAGFHEHLDGSSAAGVVERVANVGIGACREKCGCHALRGHFMQRGPPGRPSRCIGVGTSQQQCSRHSLVRCVMERCSLQPVRCLGIGTRCDQRRRHGFSGRPVQWGLEVVIPGIGVGLGLQQCLGNRLGRRQVQGCPPFPVAGGRVGTRSQEQTDRLRIALSGFAVQIRTAAVAPNVRLPKGRRCQRRCKEEYARR